MRGLPFFKAKNKPQFAGMNFSDGSGGGGGGSSTRDYTTTPVKVCKWIDNADVYQVSFELTFPNGGSGSDIEFTLANYGVENLDKIIECSAVLHKVVEGQTAIAQMNYFGSSDDVLRWYTNPAKTKFTVFCRAGYLDGGKIVVTMRYTTHS